VFYCVFFSLKKKKKKKERKTAARVAIIIITRWLLPSFDMIITTGATYILLERCGINHPAH
jgi:hypothetical protein